MSQKFGPAAVASSRPASSKIPARFLLNRREFVGLLSSIFLLRPGQGEALSSQGTVVLATDFETGTAEGWAPRIGPEILTPTTADAHSGHYSLLTTNRLRPYYGPLHDVTGEIVKGSRYCLTVWAKLAPGSPDSRLRISLQRTLGGVTNYDTVVGNTTVTPNQWAELSATYNVTVDFDKAGLYVESASGAASFYIDDFVLELLPPLSIQEDIPSIYQTLSNFFPVGAAVYSGSIIGVHAQLLTKHFNSITSENDMKWGATEPTEGHFNFINADAQVRFAQGNNMRVRGHNLVWHQQIPSWVFLDANGNPMTPTAENKALLLQRLENHITGVVTHFGDAVFAWDVVNEPIDPSQPDGFRRSPWYLIAGTDYIDTAFRVARQLAPSAQLYINDYSTTDPVKRQLLYNLIVDLKNRDVPVDGIGHEIHINIGSPSVGDIVDTLNTFAKLDIDQQITEMDMSVFTNSSQSYGANCGATAPESVLEEQGKRYHEIFEAILRAKPRINEVTFWGMADDHSWLNTSARADWPLPFDKELQAKPAYWGIIHAGKKAAGRK